MTRMGASKKANMATQAARTTHQPALSAKVA
jgi:hypothetical protein